MKKPLAKKIKRLTAHDLLVTPKYTRWLESFEDERAYPDWVIDRIAELMSKGDRERMGTFSASNSGICARRQVFQFLGAPFRPHDMDTMAVLLTGTWQHLMWQAGMLASGAVEEVETLVVDEDFRSAGTMDGRGVHEEHGSFGWEHKSINGRNFKFVLANEKPMDSHVRQTHRYMMMTGLRQFAITYDCKENQDWKEFVVKFDPDIADEVMRELIDLNMAVEEEQLPVILDGCEEKNSVWRRCPYRGICLQATEDSMEWPDDGHQIKHVLYPTPKRIRLPESRQRKVRVDDG
jgi:hypothetical protein